MKIKTAGNRFCNPAPKRDAAGLTARQFANELFEYEYCHECLKDADEHTFVIGPFGTWFAFCGSDHQNPSNKGVSLQSVA